MRKYFIWASMIEDFNTSGKLHPNSTILHFVSAKPSAQPVNISENAKAYVINEKQLNSLLRSDADCWAEHKTGDNRRPVIFDNKYSNKLFAAYKKQLLETGELDFSKPCAGVNV